jgi:hypothetical protein
MDEMINQSYKMTMPRKADFLAYLAAKPHDDWGVELTTVGHQHAAPRSTSQAARAVSRRDAR